MKVESETRPFSQNRKWISGCHRGKDSAMSTPLADPNRALVAALFDEFAQASFARVRNHKKYGASQLTVRFSTSNPNSADSGPA